MGKVDTRTLPVAAVNERRRQAVKLRIEGAKLKDIARITELSPTTIIAAYKAYLAYAKLTVEEVIVVASRVYAGYPHLMRAIYIALL